jgi:hypothetical protein
MFSFSWVVVLVVLAFVPYLPEESETGYGFEARSDTQESRATQEDNPYTEISGRW